MTRLEIATHLLTSAGVVSPDNRVMELALEAADRLLERDRDYERRLQARLEREYREGDRCVN